MERNIFQVILETRTSLDSIRNGSVFWRKQKWEIEWNGKKKQLLLRRIRRCRECPGGCYGEKKTRNAIGFGFSFPSSSSSFLKSLSWKAEKEGVPALHSPDTHTQLMELSEQLYLCGVSLHSCSFLAIRRRRRRQRILEKGGVRGGKLENDMCKGEGRREGKD